MTRRAASWPAAAALAAVLLASCKGPATLDLPADPVDRAAACGVVAAAAARVGTAVDAPLPLAAQGRILHFALLAGSQGAAFDPETASRVNRRMPVLEQGITKGRWQALAPACDAAFPGAAKAGAELPAGRFEAQLECEELAEFVTSAIEPRQLEYANALGEYRVMRGRLNDALAGGLNARAGRGREAQQAERRKALARAARLGSPIAVLDACRKRFP